MKAIVLYLFFGQFFVNSCISPNCTKSVQSDKTQVDYHLLISELAKEKFGDSFSVQENETKEFYLVTNQSKSHSETALKFFIYEKDKQLIIYEDVITLGSVKWNGRYKIDVQKYPGIVKKNDQSMDRLSYFFDVKTKQKIKE